MSTHMLAEHARGPRVATADGVDVRIRVDRRRMPVCPDESDYL